MSNPPAPGSSAYNEMVSEVRQSGVLANLSKPTQDLFTSSVVSDVAGVEDAFRRGADGKAVDTSGFNAAHHAAGTILEYENPEVYKNLLTALQKGGVDMNHKPKDYGTPLEEFVKGYREECEYPDMKNPEAVHKGAIEAFEAAGVDVSKYKRGAGRIIS